MLTLIQLIYVKKINLENIELTKSIDILCQINKDNIKLCEELSNICTDYQSEYAQEEKDLDDLINYIKDLINN